MKQMKGRVGTARNPFIKKRNFYDFGSFGGKLWKRESYHHSAPFQSLCAVP